MRTERLRAGRLRADPSRAIAILVRHAITLLLVAVVGCSTASSAETSSMCETPTLPEGGAYERCSLLEECDPGMHCAYDSSTFGGSRVSICEPECVVDDDCPEVPYDGNFRAGCSDAGRCSIGCQSMGWCPQGMVCARDNLVSRCTWTSGAAAACSAD